MISRKEVEHIAKLVRLGLSQAEIRKFQEELSLILDYVKKLQELNVSGVEPTSHPCLLENIMREDITEKPSPEKANRLVEMAPERKGRYIRAKAVLWI